MTNTNDSNDNDRIVINNVNNDNHIDNTNDRDINNNNIIIVNDGTNNGAFAARRAAARGPWHRVGKESDMTTNHDTNANSNTN